MEDFLQMSGYYVYSQTITKQRVILEENKRKNEEKKGKQKKIDYS